jgi:hypothetical protein
MSPITSANRTSPCRLSDPHPCGSSHQILACTVACMQQPILGHGRDVQCPGMQQQAAVVKAGPRSSLASTDLNSHCAASDGGACKEVGS